MPVTYTNRKGRKYYLCQGTTKSGKPRYFFSREIKGMPLETIPKGFEITESVNGVVSLARIRPRLLLRQEVTLVESALKEHPHEDEYRLDIKSKAITIFEQSGPDLKEITKMIASLFGHHESIPENINRRIEEELEIYTQYTPVMRFTLSDDRKRLFKVQRMRYFGNEADWIDIAYDTTIEEIAKTKIPVLGTDEFFELY
jgi:hypothetical protein